MGRHGGGGGRDWLLVSNEGWVACSQQVEGSSGSGSGSGNGSGSGSGGGGEDGGYV